MSNKMITVEVTVNASSKAVWQAWTLPAHITNWNFASADWTCPKASNDLRSGGSFNWRMEAADGSMGFDFTGKYDEVKEEELITYTMTDGRKVVIKFSSTEDGIHLSESFEAEGTNADEMQRAGWQAILNNFKKYVESI